MSVDGGWANARVLLLPAVTGAPMASLSLSDAVAADCSTPDELRVRAPGPAALLVG